MPQRAHVLIVDDDERNRRVVSGMLASAYDLHEAESGPAALEIVERAPVDLVILDVMMPGMDGYEVCWKLKARAGDEFLPVIFLTALREQEDREFGLATGGDEFLTKPVQKRELLLRVQALLKLREQEALIRSQIQELRALQALKDELASMIVHDVRNPLSGVIGYLRGIL